MLIAKFFLLFQYNSSQSVLSTTPTIIFLQPHITFHVDQCCCFCYCWYIVSWIIFIFSPDVSIDCRVCHLVSATWFILLAGEIIPYCSFCCCIHLFLSVVSTPLLHSLRQCHQQWLCTIDICLHERCFTSISEGFDWWMGISIVSEWRIKLVLW